MLIMFALARDNYAIKVLLMTAPDDTDAMKRICKSVGFWQMDIVSDFGL